MATAMANASLIVFFSGLNQLVLLRYMRPEGPWQRLHRSPKAKEKTVPGPPCSSHTPWPSTASGHNSIFFKLPRSPSSCRGGKVTILQALMSRGNCRTAGVALSSLKSSLMVDARGCFHLQASPTPFHNSLVWASQARHLIKQWCRDWRSPLLHHQHWSARIAFVNSAR